MDNEKLSQLVRQWLAAVGEDPDRDGLKETPSRVAEAWERFTSGYRDDVAEILEDGVFEETHDGLVVIKDIDFYSLCEHHLVPFFGRCHVGYVPSGRILGLSKAARIVEVFARRLQVQERMTQEIAETLEKHLAPAGVAVVVEAQHLCMMMRGVERHNSSAVTSELRGVLKNDTGLISAFYHQIGKSPDANPES